ncbi:MAG: PF13754 domain-containing protein [Lachnospiraceae bacterium]|nr:PF13754 domain-containing protein [Lachnospiraceae bacterium]
MAVSRVFGRVDGVKVVLQQGEGDRWSVPVPMDQDGEYVVEIIAEDEAGNQSCMARLLFVVNTSLLCVHMMPILYCAELREPTYSAGIAPKQYYAELIESQCTKKGGKLCSV